MSARSCSENRPSLRHRQVDRRAGRVRRERRGRFPPDARRYRVVLRILVHQAERVVVLAIEIEQASGAVFVPVRHVESVWQRDPSRKRGVDVDGDSFAGMEVQRRSTGDVHAGSAARCVRRQSVRQRFAPPALGMRPRTRAGVRLRPHGRAPLRASAGSAMAATESRRAIVRTRSAPLPRGAGLPQGRGMSGDRVGGHSRALPRGPLERMAGPKDANPPGGSCRCEGRRPVSPPAVDRRPPARVHSRSFWLARSWTVEGRADAIGPVHRASRNRRSIATGGDTVFPSADPSGAPTRRRTSRPGARAEVSVFSKSDNRVVDFRINDQFD